MTRMAFMLQVKVERLEEYKRHHREVWPEMLAALSRQGWHNYSLFLRENGQLFGYVEVAESVAASVQGMAGEEINTKWQEMMAPFFADISGHPDESLLRLEEVFHLD
jgi:L-rhamnose mutarotase